MNKTAMGILGVGGALLATGLVLIMRKTEPEPEPAGVDFTVVSQGSRQFIFIPIITGGVQDYPACAWDFGDGSTGGGWPGQHTYAEDGTYEVKLTATDSLAGTVLSHSKSVVVKTSASGTPNCSFTAVQLDSDEYHCYYRFTATVSGGVEPYTFRWDFGDGYVTSNPGYNPAEHEYLFSGTYTVRLTVYDDAGNISNVATRTVEVSLA